MKNNVLDKEFVIEDVNTWNKFIKDIGKPNTYEQMCKYRDLAKEVYSVLYNACAELKDKGFPVLVKPDPDPDSSDNDYVCPACGDTVRIWLDGTYAVDCYYCPHCGQKLDWGGVDPVK